jgi:GNAT superfamily N-acetyltransferase
MNRELHAVCGEADMAELETLINEIWPEVFVPIIGEAQVAYMLEHYQSPAVIREQMAAGTHYFLVRVDDVSCGYLAWEEQGDALFLSKIYLRREMRGKGVAGWMLARCEQEARERGLRRMTLHVNRYNETALQVYLHKGFVINAEVDEPLGEFWLTDYHMEKVL